MRDAPEFRKLFAAGLLSALGSSVSGFALPLTAAVTLGAGPAEMGILTAAGTLPNLVFGLPAGVLVDRLPRRAIMVASDLGRVFAIGSIPAAAFTGQLRVEQLYAVTFIAATLGLAYDVADTAVRRHVLSPERLADGNAALALNNQVAKLAGPPIAGILIGLLTAPVALTLDAISLGWSALLLTRMRIAEDSRPLADRAAWWTEIGEGLHLVGRDPILRAIVGASALGQLGGAIQAPLLLLFLVRDLQLTPAMIGLIFAATGVGAFPGSLLARPLADRIGPGRAIATGTLFSVLGMAVVPLVAGPPVLVVVLLALSQAIFGIGVPIFSINHLTLRQLAAPDHLQGRVTATRRFLMFAATPFGAVLSGYLGASVGLRPTLLIGATFMALALAWTVRSPLWPMHREAAATVKPEAGGIHE